MYDYIIVGSGLFGSVFAYMAKQNGFKCLVLEKRHEIGGNCRTEKFGDITVHKYGPHVFHTNNKETWDFMTQFADFNNYVNSPLAYNGDDDMVYNLPFNMNTFKQIWDDVKTSADAKAKIESDKMGITNPQNLEEQAISMVGKTIYEKLIKGYTEKQWGRDCKDLPADIIKRIPLRFNYNNNYFNDKYQGVPIGGYNQIFEKLLDGIEVKTDTDYLKDKEYWDSQAKTIVYTGRIDEFYDNKYGSLDWRTLRWEHGYYTDRTEYQGTAIVNYTTKDVNYTRIVEHKFFEALTDEESNEIPYTIITREFPVEFKEGMEPFYPINDKKNTELYNKYKKLADGENNVIFGGRLAEYKYYDMAPVIEKALSYWKKK